MQLQSELAGPDPISYGEFRAVEARADPFDVEGAGDNETIELVGVPLPPDVEDRGYFEDPHRCAHYLRGALRDPTWETVMWAHSMWNGGVADWDAIDAVFGGPD